MRKLLTLGIAATFALATSAMMLASAIHTAANAPQGFYSVAARPALADDERDSGDRGKGRGDRDRGHGRNCFNSAGHERGWCKHRDRDDQADRHQYGHSTVINGTVIGVNGRYARMRLDNGRVITIDENGALLNIGQRYSLNGCYQNNVFVVGCGGNYRGGDNAQVGGTILSVHGSTVTLAGLPPVTINVSQAVANGRTNGALTPLRHITAYGYYQNNTFYATTIR